MAKVVTVTTIKGGTGKTSTAGAIAQVAKVSGDKVLAVDLDIQCSLSMWLRADLKQHNTWELLNGKVTATEAIQHTQSGIDVICGHADLIGARTSPGSARRIEKAMQPVLDSYDLIMIDTAPTAGELQNNALFAADGVIIPIGADPLSLQGFYQTMKIITHVQTAKAIDVLGVVITRYDGRPNLSRKMRDVIIDQCDKYQIPYLGEIRRGIAIEEAQAYRTSLYEYAPKSKPAVDYMALYEKAIHGIV